MDIKNKKYYKVRVGKITLTFWGAPIEDVESAVLNTLKKLKDKGVKFDPVKQEFVNINNK